MRTFFALYLTASVMLSAVETPGLLFACHYDTYNVIADFAKGKSESLNFKTDLQLRMHPGIDGKGNALCLNGKEFCAYQMKDNFQTQRGTVNLWISPKNWSFSEKRYQVFFEARQDDFRLILYKYRDNPFVCLYLQHPDGTEVANAKLTLDDWPKDSWHMITATWDRDGVRLYVDGRQPKDYAPGNSHPAFPTRKFSKALTFPSVSASGVVGLGNVDESFRMEEGDSTAFDSLEIFDCSLPADEIQAKYEAIRPPDNRNPLPAKLTIPIHSRSIVADGILNVAEWADAIVIPFMKAYKIANHKMPSTTLLRLKADGDYLHCGFSTDLANTRHLETKNDSPVYTDDCLEIFFQDKDQRELWFDINANGAVYDARDGDPVWDSGAIAAGKSFGDKGWCVEVSIPLTALGSPGVGEFHQATFHALNFAKAPNYYLSWTGSPENKFVGACIAFGPNANTVSIPSLGNIYAGMVDIKAISQGACNIVINGTEIPLQDGHFAKKLSPGKYALEIISGSSFRFPLTFYVNHPLSLSYSSYPSQGFIEVKVDFAAAGAEISDNFKHSQGLVKLLCDGKGVSEAFFTPESVSYINLPLPKNLPPGSGLIVAEITGASTLREEISFRIPSAVPYEKKLGLDHTVPEPWIPVSEKGDFTFAILDREYAFGQSPFPATMFSRGRNVLASMPVLSINGVEVTWENRQLEARHADFVVLSGTGNALGLQFQWRGQLWFDGLWLLDFSMTPSSPTKIRVMTLTWSVPAESAKYFLNRYKDGYVTIPWSNDAIATGLNLADAAWLTGVETGMMWLPLHSANWVAGHAKAYNMQRGDNAVQVTLHIIAKESILEKAADYSIAFMATPGKRPPKNFRSVNVGGYADNRYANAQICSTSSDRDREDSVAGYSGHSMLYPDRFRATWEKQYRARGIGLFPYHQPKGLTLFDAEWDFFLAEWKTLPGYTQAAIKQGDKVFDFVHCCGEGIADLMAFRIEKLYADFLGITGIYYDICDVGQCSNSAHGHGGIDAFGKSFSTSTAISLRNYLMRIYKISHKYGKRVFNHAHNYFNPVAHNFTDYWYPGENEVWLYGNNPDYYYCEAPPDEYQAAWSSTIRGTAMVRCNQVSRVLFMDKLKARSQELNGERMAIRSFASAWLYDFNVDSDWINNRAVEKLWNVRAQLNLDEAIFFGYWFDGAARSDSDHVKIARYQLKNAPWSQLLAVCNMGRTDAPAKLRTELLDGVSEVTELWSGRKIQVADLDSEVVPENGFLLLAF